MAAVAYMIRNNINQKVYVGITERSVSRRWYEHTEVANSCGKFLHKAIKKHGKENFELIVLASCIGDRNDLLDLEKKLIKQYNSFAPSGYNLTTGGDGVFGYKHDPKIGVMIAQNNKLRIVSNETKQKMSESHKGSKNSFYGKTHSEITKQKISEAKTGQVGPWAGKKRSEETKQKISEAHKRRRQVATQKNSEV